MTAKDTAPVNAVKALDATTNGEAEGGLAQEAEGDRLTSRSAASMGRPDVGRPIVVRRDWPFGLELTDLATSTGD